MREILFKAKRIDNGEWIEGDLVHSVYKINDTCVGKYGGNVGLHQVDQDTLCQFTGLTDKNGKKIWENDIVNIVYSNFAGEVCHSDGYIIKDLRDACVIGWLDKANELEVAGNIFDNPELMEGE